MSSALFHRHRKSKHDRVRQNNILKAALELTNDTNWIGKEDILLNEQKVEEEEVEEKEDKNDNKTSDPTQSTTAANDTSGSTIFSFLSNDEEILDVKELSDDYEESFTGRYMNVISFHVCNEILYNDQDYMKQFSTDLQVKLYALRQQALFGINKNAQPSCMVWLFQGDLVHRKYDQWYVVLANSSLTHSMTL